MNQVSNEKNKNFGPFAGFLHGSGSTCTFFTFRGIYYSLELSRKYYMSIFCQTKE
jgi:hypothetical protein